MVMAKIIKEKLNPDQVILAEKQQNRFSKLSGIEVNEIKRMSIAQLQDKLKWQLDPRFFFFEKICGKVVKKNHFTGHEYPVPFATVNVFDTDCHIIFYHPHGHPWCWHFPYHYHRELIGKTKTDACGNFCVWVPRFDIDWILHWRKLWHCDLVFKRPHIIDYIPERKWPPIPIPDPDPWEELDRLTPSIINSIPGNKAEFLNKEISRIKNSVSSEMNKASIESLLNQRVFDNEMPPPLSEEFQKALSGQNIIASKGASATDAIRSDIRNKLGMDISEKELEKLDLHNYRGPFYRCHEVIVPEWQLVRDVPDITFSVTQDINGDGNEETIYSEGYFDVRWNSGPISNITLLANSNAKENRFCNIPDLPCKDIPDLQMAGMLPLENASYFDKIDGFAVRPNRPKPTGILPRPPAQTPFCGTLGLFGCVDVKDAKYYRLQQSTNGINFAPITGLSWNNYILPGTPIPIVADVNGWYPVQPINPLTLSAVPRTSLYMPFLILDWPTPNLQKTILRIELGNNSKVHLAYSNKVAIQSDNNAPSIVFTKLSWKSTKPGSTFQSLLGIQCPMIKRGATPEDIEVVFEIHVSAPHLRNAFIGTSGCGDGIFMPISDPLNNYTHWHQNVLDNNVTLYQRYFLRKESSPGCYSFNAFAASRTMNPSGADGGNLLPADWFYDPVYKYYNPSISVAIVNED
jgi:hypothetical protein